MVDAHTSSQEAAHNATLLYVLENRMNQARSAGQMEALKKMEKAMQGLQAEIASEQAFQDGLDQVQGYDRLLSRISEGKFNYVDIQALEISGLEYFLESELVEGLKISASSMQFGDRARNILGSKPHELSEQASRNFESALQRANQEVLKNKALPSDHPEKRNLKYLEAQRSELSKQRNKWIQKEIYRLRSSFEEKARFDRYLGDGQAEKIANMLQEARDIRMEKLREYSLKQVDLLWNKWSRIPDELQSKEAVARQIGEIEDYCKNNDVSHPKLINSFRNVASELDQINIDSNRIYPDRESFKNRIRARHRRLKTSRLHEPKIEAMARKGWFKKAQGLLRAGMMALQLSASPVTPSADNPSHSISTLDDGAVSDKLSSKIENIDDLSDEELIALNQDLEILDKNAGLVDAQNAFKAIEALNEAQNSLTIQEALSDHIGADHIQYVDDSGFDAYKEYSHTGYMVMYQRGDDWKIIINKDAIEDQNVDLERLKRQFRHELYHVQFEKGGMTQDEGGGSISFREKMERDFVTEDPKSWDRIRSAFIGYVNDIGDKDSHGGSTWPDEDVLSELFAMQDELGKVQIQKGRGRGEGGSLSKLDILNNLVWAHGLRDKSSELLKKELELDEGRTLGYKEANYVDPNDPQDYKNSSYVDPNDVAIDSEHNGPQEAESMSESEQKTRQERISLIKDRIDELKVNPEVKLIPEAMNILDDMDAYNGNSARMNASGMYSGTEIDDRCDQLEKDIKSIVNAVTKVANSIGNDEMGLFRRVWNNTTFLSLNDFLSAGKQAVEYIKRRMTRRGEDHAAKINKAFFGGSGLGLEATAQEQQTEATEVGEWEKRYDLLDPFQLEDLLKGISKATIPDRDQLKAIMRVLAKKGRLRWENQDLWRALNKLQSKTYLRLGDPILLRDPNQLRVRLNAAISSIYDKDEHPTLEQKNSSAYASSKQEKDSTNKDTALTLGSRLSDNLRDHSKETRKIDPSEQESIIEFCIKNGAASGEVAVFHLMAGMAQGILSPKAGMNLSDYMNQWPPIQVFFGLQFTQKEFQEYCMRHFPNDYKNGEPGEEFRSWMFTYVMNNPIVRDRVKKSISGRKWDPDWVRTISCVGDAEIIKQHLSGRAGQVETTGPAVEGTYVGLLQYLEENAINPAYAGRNEFARIAGNIAMMEGIIDSTAFRTGGQDNYARGIDNNATPNEAGMGRYGGKTVGFHRKKLTHFLDLVEPNLFQKLRGREVTGKAKVDLAEEIKEYIRLNQPKMYQNLNFAAITESDQIFSKIREITEFLFKEMSVSKFNDIRSRVAAEAGQAPPGL